ncbi:MAG: hypothetical protein ACI82S_003423 [Patiriisocius sp.]|jgi:hypothetical protein
MRSKPCNTTTSLSFLARQQYGLVYEIHIFFVYIQNMRLKGGVM